MTRNQRGDDADNELRGGASSLNGGPQDAGVQSEERWPVLYILNLLAAGLLCYQKGSLLVQGEIQRILLLDGEDRVVDSWGLCARERIS